MDERPSEGSSQIVAERPVETRSSAYGVTKQAGVLERPLRCFSSFDEAREERKRVVTNIETKAVAKRRTNLRLTLLVSFRGGGSCSPSLSSAQDFQTAAGAQYEKAGYWNGSTFLCFVQRVMG